jgi:hypothetical protein
LRERAGDSPGEGVLPFPFKGEVGAAG